MKSATHSKGLVALDTFGRLEATLEDRDARHGQRLEKVFLS